MGNYYEVTFYNVRVPYLTEFHLADGRVTKEYPVGGEDGIIHVPGSLTISDMAITGSMYEAMLVAEPTTLSTVDVKAKGQDSVEDGTVTDITVTYAATDMIYIDSGASTTVTTDDNINTISIELPSLWEPAHPPNKSSLPDGEEPGDFAGFGDRSP